MTSFDVIVVGSGMSGGWVAKEMAEKGFKVAVIERGRKIDKSKDYTDFVQPWEMENLGEATAEDKLIYPTQSEVYAFKPYTRQFWVKDAEYPYSTAEDQEFAWLRGHQEGGRSITWGRQSYRWNELDFEANKKEQIAIDWPVRYKDIEKWYDYVEEFAGIAGSTEGLDVLPDGVFQPAFDLNCGEAWLKESIENDFPGRKLIPARVANLTAPTKIQMELGRGQCQVRNHCFRGCSFGAYFSSVSATLPAAERTGNYTLIPDSAVSEVIYDEQQARVTGVKLINSVTGVKSQLTAKVVFLNASTIATSVILLNSRSDKFPNGLANSSGEVGRNLMDHVFGVGAVGVITGLSEKYYAGRRPAGFYIPRYRNYPEAGADSIRGFGYQGECMRLDWRSGSTSAGIGEEFKEKLRQPSHWAVYLGAFCEMLPDPGNRVSLHKSERDKDGIPIPMIDMKLGKNESALADQASNDALEMLETAGCMFVSKIEGDEGAAKPGSAVHEMGTARMGNDPATSVLNKWNQAHDVPNLFVTDGSFMTSSSCVNPSLTYMAFSARAADYAATQIRDGAI